LLDSSTKFAKIVAQSTTMHEEPVIVSVSAVKAA